MSEVIIGYKLTRSECPGFMFAGTTAEEVAEALKHEIESEEGLSVGECDAITIIAYETTQQKIDEMPEFPGW